MTDFLIETRLFGLAAGAFTFLIIGLFHPLVIKAEYHIGTRSWTIFLAAGIVSGALSATVGNPLLSVLLGVVSFSSLWSILEVFQQEKRVMKGWFPENPEKKNKKTGNRERSLTNRDAPASDKNKGL